MLVSVIAEAQPIWGMHQGAPMVAAFRDARRHPQLLRGLARLALAHRPPTGFLRDIVVEHSGEHAGRLDIKHGGLLPIVDLARYAGLAAGVTSATTRDRLRTAAGAGTLAAADARTLESAFDLISELRLAHQIEQLRAGLQPDDHLDPATLDRLTRSYLRDAFRAISKVQRRIASDLELRVAMRLPRPLIQRPRSPAARTYRRASVDIGAAVAGIAVRGRRPRDDRPRRAEARDHLLGRRAGRRGPHPRRRRPVRAGATPADARGGLDHRARHPAGRPRVGALAGRGRGRAAGRRLRAASSSRTRPGSSARSSRGRQPGAACAGARR